MKNEFPSRVYTDRPAYSDFDSQYRICGTGWVLCDGKCWNCNKNAYVTTDHTFSNEEFVTIVGSPHTGGGIIPASEEVQE